MTADFNPNFPSTDAVPVNQSEAAPADRLGRAWPEPKTSELASAETVQAVAGQADPGLAESGLDAQNQDAPDPTNLDPADPVQNNPAQNNPAQNNPAQNNPAQAVLAQDASKPDEPDEREMASRFLYVEGCAAFERGDYRQSVDKFEKAVALARPVTSLGGEIQTWLVNAYAATERTPEAISLCEKLSHHPDWDTREQGKRLLYILQAPKLKSRPEWLSQIPDLGNLSDQGSGGFQARTSAPRRRSQPRPEPEPLDLSQVNTQDNRFLWVALGGAGLVIAGLLWLG